MTQEFNDFMETRENKRLRTILARIEAKHGKCKALEYLGEEIIMGIVAELYTEEEALSSIRQAL